MVRSHGMKQPMPTTIHYGGEQHEVWADRTLEQLLAESQPTHAEYHPEQAEGKKDFVTVHLNLDKQDQKNLSILFKDWLSGIFDPLEFALLRWDLMRLRSVNPRDDTPRQIAIRSFEITRYQLDYQGTLNQVRMKNPLIKRKLR